MDRVIKFLQYFYDGTGFDTLAIITLCIRIFMFISIFVFAYSIFWYIKQYKLIEALISKLSGDARNYDRIRRAQMKAEIEARKNAFEKIRNKKSLINKIYILITQTGVMEKIPGFSESIFLAFVIILGILLFIIMAYFKGIIVGLFSSIAFLIVSWYCLSLLAYNRKIKLEEQLLQFTNACATASMQHADLIDIFGAIYDQFKEPLREGLEMCYVEAKQTNNKVMAIEHLKEKYDSVHFTFVIDNLELCSQATGDYNSAARDIAETLSIYMASHEKKKVTLRNAKINISIMFVVGIGIFIALSQFLDNLSETLLNTPIGNIGLISLVLLYFYSLNLKTEK